jgi:RsiW-degrading membrane proteinase PrsW (M82 family)
MTARFITPPPEKEEIYPYRRVWRSLLIESGTMLLIAGVLYALIRVLNAPIPQSLYVPISQATVILPFALWLVFSWLVERTVPQPRPRLFTLLILAALVANAVGVPLITQFYRVDDWLPLASAADRIIGYTFTVGMVNEFLKYLVLRFLVWMNDFRTWQDAAAYGITCGLGYALVLNLHYVFGNTTVPPDVVAMRVFETLVLHVLGGLLVAYGLAETRFNPDSFLITPLMLLLAALVSGIAIPIRAGLVNSNLTTEGISAAQPLFGLGFAAALLAGVGIILAFMYDRADRRQVEAEMAAEK